MELMELILGLVVFVALTSVSWRYGRTIVIVCAVLAFIGLFLPEEAKADHLEAPSQEDFNFQINMAIYSAQTCAQYHFESAEEANRCAEYQARKYVEQLNEWGEHIPEDDMARLGAVWNDTHITE